MRFKKINTAYHTLTALMVLCLFLWGQASAAAAPGPKRVAVLSVDAGASSRLAEQLVVALSGDPAFALVERERLQQITEEQKLAGLGAASGNRVTIGKMLGADLLVLLKQDEAADGLGEIMLVCDCATGARLGQLRLGARAVEAETLGAEVRATLARFPEGVTSIVALPDLIDRDLALTYAGLQTSLADLLRNALSREKGVAVLELAEARAIAEEMNVAGGAVRRVTLLFAEGEFRTESQADEAPTISVWFVLRPSRDAETKITSDRIPLSQASAFVLEQVGPRILEAAKQPVARGFDGEQEYEQLIARGNRFAEVGDFERSAALREAALLLKPDADEQRVRLVREYVRHNLTPVEVWPKGHTQALADPFWATVVAQSRSTWRRSLQHVEFLIHNRRVDAVVGTALFSDAIHSICGIRATTAHALTDEENIKKQFIREIAPLLFKLESKADGDRLIECRSSCAYALCEKALFRTDGNFLARDDLDLLGDLLCESMPANTPSNMIMLYRLSDGRRMFSEKRSGATVDDWLKFTDRLYASDRPVVHAYGQYARICDQRQNPTPEQLADAKSLVEQLSREPLKSLDPSGDFRRRVSDEVARMAIKLEPKPKRIVRGRTTAPTLPDNSVERPAQARPVDNADGSISSGRVRLAPIPLMLDRDDDGSGRLGVLENMRWRAAGGFASWSALVPAWDKIDVIYSGGAVLFLGPDGVAKEVLKGEKLSIHSVVFDGEYVWAASGYDAGIYSFDRNGKIVAHVTPAEGLPSAYVVMPIHPLAPGKILAAGSIGQRGRSWLATIELTNDKPKVNVFHEAVKAWDYRNTPREQHLDPAMRFQPNWIVEHRELSGKRWLFIDRQRSVLIVDPDSLAVSVYPSAPVEKNVYFPRIEEPASAFLSSNGLFYVAGSQSDFRAFRYDADRSQFAEASKRPDRQWHYGNATTGCLAVHDGWLYYAGAARWIRHELSTGRDEVLVSDPRSLPAYGDGGGWQLRVSSSFGLVGWHSGKLYRMSVLDGDNHNP